MIMRNQSHTLIGVLREAVDQWRRREGWSRESVVQAIVDAHLALGADAATGIGFDPATRDTYERMKVNADRVFRWLDDVSKDSTLLPTNFLPSILFALPLDLRLHCLNAFLRPLGMEARSADAIDGGTVFDVSRNLKEIMKEGTEAQLALIGVNGDSSLEVLRNALREVEESCDVNARTARDLKTMIAARETVAGKLRAVP
jgi:hypothetical protein